MGRTPCCDKANVKKGPWSPEEDAKLNQYIQKHGTGGNWISLPQKAGLKRCGKSCRLRWLNYLRPHIKHGDFSEQEDRLICNLFATIGSRWSVIAAQLAGRTDNDIKNYWNTKLKKKFMSIMQSSTTSSSSSSPSSYSDSNQTNHPQQPTWCFSTTNNFEPISLSSATTTTTTTTTTANLILKNDPSFFSNYNAIAAPSQIHHQQEQSFFNPNSSSSPIIQNYDNLLVFGSEAVSCSSSDGSKGGGGGGGGDAEYRGRSGGEISDQQIMAGNKQRLSEIVYRDTSSDNGLWTETPLDYGLEEIKQLITSGSCCSNLFF